MYNQKSHIKPLGRKNNISGYIEEKPKKYCHTMRYNYEKSGKETVDGEDKTEC